MINSGSCYFFNGNLEENGGVEKKAEPSQQAHLVPSARGLDQGRLPPLGQAQGVGGAPGRVFTKASAPQSFAVSFLPRSRAGRSGCLRPGGFRSRTVGTAGARVAGQAHPHLAGSVGMVAQCGAHGSGPGCG